MSIKIGSISAKDFYVGSTPAKEIRLGSTLIWSREPEEVYYTLALNGVDSAGIDDYDVKINGEYQPKQTTYQILQGSFVQVSINADTTNYYYDFTSNIGGEADAGDGWYMDKDVIITVTTTPIEIEKCVITINTAEAPNFDYAYGEYRMSGSDSWYQILDDYEDYHLDSFETVSVPKNSEIKLSANSFDGTKIQISPNNFIITEDTIVNFSSIESSYELNIQIKHNGYASDVSELTVKVNGDMVLNESNSSGATITHDGTEPIDIEVSDLKSLSNWEWTGSIQPTIGADTTKCHWDNLPENGTLTVEFTN